MCGITGFVDFSEFSGADELRRMNDTLKRRGPDDGGEYLTHTSTAQIGLAQRRLAILDLSSAGHQPYHFDHLSLIYNGEVYNFQEIQKKLVQEGYSFDSHSDTEVIIKAFHCWGTEAVQQFRGMFAFCLYDARQEILYLFRDRVGVKPLYYYRKDKLFLFGSTLAPLMQHPRFEKRLANTGLSHYTQFGYIPAPHSIFENTFKLRPGHYATFDLKTQQFVEHRYWSIRDYPINPQENLSEGEATEALEALLQEAFQLRMVSDVPVGCFLSGGIDSSLVAAILQKKQSTSLHTFTIGFQEKTYDEASYAKKVSEHLGTIHTEHYCTKKDALDIIPSLPAMYDEPFADDSAISTFLVAKLAKNHVKVVLSGDGGDEIFGGYTVYEKLPRIFNSIKKIPCRKTLARLAALIPDPILSIDAWHPHYYKKYLKIKALLPLENDSLLYKIAQSEFTPCEIQRLLGFYIAPTASGIFSGAMQETMMLTDFENYLPEDILLKVDRATMYTSLEGREPLLDHKIIEYAATLPLPYKQQKKILKNILARYLPRELFERKKHGFGPPLNEWLQSDLQFLVHDYLDETKIQKEGLFNRDYVKHLKKKLFSKKVLDRQVWNILMFQMWKEHYL